MEFLNPWMLAAAASAAVPIVLHLIMRQTPQRVVFPALRFIRQRNEANRRRLRLRHLLLLLLRAGALVLLALALARPAMNAAGFTSGRQSPVSAALVFDTSPSMDYEHQSQTRLAAAQETGEWLVQEFPADSEVAVLDLTGGAPVFQVDLAAARGRIERLQTTVAPERFLDVVGEALKLLKTGKHQTRELYLFTDRCKTAWNAERAGELQTLIRELRGLGVHVIDVGAEPPQNSALGELHLSGQSVARNSPVRLRLEVSRAGEPLKKLVQLYVHDRGGQLQKRDELEVNLTDGSSEEIEFVLGALEVGTHQGEVRFVGRDALACDDRRFFTVEVVPPWRVLLAAPSPAEYYAFDMREALAPEALRIENRARFACDVAVLDELATRKLADYAAVCLLDPQPLTPAAWTALAEYVRAGGSVAICLGRKADANAFNLPAAQALLAGPMVQQAHWPSGVVLEPVNYQHPVLAKFQPLKDSVPWDAFPVFRYWQLGQLAQGARTLIPYSNGQPALVERRIDQGIVLTMTTPVSDELDKSAWNTLPTGLEPWPFVMLANEMMLYLAGSADEQLNYLAQPGLTAVLQRPAKEVRSYLLRAPSEEGFRSTSPNDPRIVVSVPAEVGNYRVEQREAGLDRGFSVNLPAEESDLTQASEADLKAVFGETEFRLARDTSAIERNVTKVRVGTELFPWVMMLVAVILGLEHVLANRFYKDAAPGGTAGAASTAGK